MAYQRPILVDSIYRHAPADQLPDGTVIFLLPERVEFEDDDDVIIHRANANEYLWDICMRYYGQVQLNTMDLPEVLANFQPDPILDLSLPLAEGRDVYIPSMDFIQDVAKGPSLADTPAL